MAEYIEREKYVKLNDIIETLEHEWGYEGMREDLYNLPTANVVEVVRCGKCKCYEEMQSENAHFCNRFGGYVTEHDYCSRAEKKEGAEE